MLPQLSAAIYVRVNVYLLKQSAFVVASPAHVTITAPEQLSLVVTRFLLGVGICDAQVTVTAAGHAMNGRVVSRTLTSCWQVEKLPHKSDAMNVRWNVYVFGQKNT